MTKLSLVAFFFTGFAFLIGSMIVLSIIPLYIEKRSVAKTSFILTSMIDGLYYKISKKENTLFMFR